MSDIFVLAEHRKGEMRDVTLEMLTLGRELAKKTGNTLTAVVLGPDQGSSIGAAIASANSSGATSSTVSWCVFSSRGSRSSGKAWSSRMRSAFSGPIRTCISCSPPASKDRLRCCGGPSPR